jgi:hypothetical protein
VLVGNAAGRPDLLKDMMTGMIEADEQGRRGWEELTSCLSNGTTENP